MPLEVVSRPPVGSPRPTPLLFVHGAWHAAWCWENFLGYFAERGYAAHALSLPGHGGSPGRERLRWTRIAEYAAAVIEVAQGLPTPPVLIGHSMGGLTVQKALETCAAPAGVLLASVPPGGVLAGTLRLSQRHPLVLLRVNLTFSLAPVVGTPALAREVLFSPGTPEAVVRACHARLQDESYLAFLDMLALDLPRPDRVRAPLLVLGGAQDGLFPPAEVEATARACGVQATVFPDMGHDLMLEPGWPQVAAHIAAWLEARGL